MSATASVRSIRNLAFPTRSGTELAFELHLPEADDGGATPLVIYLHGGGWRGGDRRDYEASRQLPVAAHGLAVASIDYRLSGEALWPAQLDDVADAIANVPGIARAHGARLDGTVALWGSSAGGHLALMAAFDEAARVAGDPTISPVVSAVVAWFAPTDLVAMGREPLPETARLPAFISAGATIPPYAQLLTGIPADAPADADGTALLTAASPTAHVVASAAPVLLVHGDDDALIPPWHSHELQRRISAAGGRVSARFVAGATHEDSAIETPELLAATARFLAQPGASTI